MSITFHGSLQSVDRIHLCDDDASAESPESLSATFAHITVASNYSYFACQHHVCGTLDAINQRLTAAIQVVKLALETEDTNDPKLLSLSVSRVRFQYTA